MTCTLTLQDFLLANRGGRKDYDRFEGFIWVKLYEVACESLELRPNGLQYHDRVVSLHSGFGGGPGVRMIVGSPVPDLSGCISAVKADRNWEVVAGLSTGSISVETWWKTVAFETDKVRELFRHGY